MIKCESVSPIKTNTKTFSDVRELIEHVILTEDEIITISQTITITQSFKKSELAKALANIKTLT